MTALSIYLNHPHGNAYGAAELKENIRTNTYKGFVVTMSALLLIAIISLLSPGRNPNIINDRVGGPIEWFPLAPTKSDEGITTKLPPPRLPIDLVRTEYVAGKPSPIAGDIKKDIGTFAGVDQLPNSLSTTEGTLIKPEDIPNLINSNQVNIPNVVKPEPIPDIEEPSFVEKEPALDLAELQRTVIYPQMAIKTGLEGTSIIRVLVDKTGKPVKVVVFASAAPILDKAATDAVMKAIFTPAIQNGATVQCWINVPIKFKLR